MDGVTRCRGMVPVDDKWGNRNGSHIGDLDLMVCLEAKEYRNLYKVLEYNDAGICYD